MTRRAPAWAILIALIAALTLAPAAPAAAAPFDCKDAPTPTQPSTGGPAWFGAQAAQEDTGADPFAAGSTTTVYREYGWPTNWWPTYDLGCGPDVARAPQSVIGSFAANLMAGGTLMFATSFDALVHSVLDWKGLQVVDESLVGIVTDLRQDIWAPLIILSILLTAAWFLLVAMRGDVRAATRAAGLTMITALALVIILNYPQKSAQMFDSAVKGAVAVSYTGTVPDADSGAEIADGIVGRVFQATMYDRWCEGMLGGGRAAADQWCPRLWTSMYLSRTEAALEGDAKSDLVEKKKDQFEEVAEEIKDKDPAAYSVLTGSDYQTRMFAATSAGVVWPLVSFFPIVALFMLMVSLMIMRVAVLFAPIAGPLMLHPAFRKIARSTLHVIGGSVLYALLFGVASAIFLRLVVAIMAATDMPLVVRLIALAVLTAAVWIITKPIKRLRQMRSRKTGEPNGSAKSDTEPNRGVAQNATAPQTIKGQPAPPPNAEAGNR